MKEKIKEILDKLKESAIWYEDSKQLLDYITNLQEENERLNNIIDKLEKWLKESSKYEPYEYNGILDKLKEINKQIELLEEVE